MMEKDLPEGWAYTTVKEISERIHYGYTASSTIEDTGVKLLRITDIQNDKVHWERVPFCEITLKDLEKYLLKDGDLVFARTGATVGKSFLLLGTIPNAAFASYLIRIIIKKGINKFFIYYFFKSESYWRQISDNARGIGQPNVNAQTLSEINFPLPPLAEQKRIVAKLDAAFGLLDRMKERLARIPELLKTFRQAVLTQAVTGKLTEENEKSNWIVLNLDSIADLVDPHPSHRTPPVDEQGIPYISIGDIRKDKTIDFDNARKVSTKILEEHTKRYSLKEGDFVFGKIGTLGKPVLLPIHETRDYVLSANVILVLPRKQIFGKFLYYYMDSPVIDRILKDGANATSQAAFGIKKARNIQINLPPLAEQQEIVRRVEALLAKADALEAQYLSLKEKIDRLPQALLAQAFRGELVPQDPNDEPAAVLLEKIKKSKAVGKQGVLF